MQASRGNGIGFACLSCGSLQQKQARYYIARRLMDDIVETESARLVLVADQNDPSPTLTAREFLKSGQVIETHWTELEPLHVLDLRPTEREHQGNSG